MTLLAVALVVAAVWSWAPGAAAHLLGGARRRSGRPSTGLPGVVEPSASASESSGVWERRVASETSKMPAPSETSAMSDAGAPQPSGRGRGRWSRRRRRSDDEELLAAVDALAPALEAGLPVPLAVDVAVSQVRDPHVRQFLSGLAEPGGREVARGDGAELLGRAWRLCHDLGAPLSEATRTVASLIRAERARAREVEAALAEARATVRVLVALPLLGPGLAAGIGVGPTELYGSPAAVACGLAGLALLLVGRWWMGRLVLRVGESARLR